MSGVEAPAKPYRLGGRIMTNPSAASLPQKLCACGCGEIPPIATATNRKRGYVAGQPINFLKGHKLPLKHNTQFDDALPFKIDGVYCRLIPLTKGLYAIVDNSDYEWLSAFTWHATWNYRTRSFYAHRKALRSEPHPGKTIPMHRQILGLGYGDERVGDHKETRQTLDNRRNNLRIVDDCGNARNTPKRRNNTSGFKGVSQLPSGHFQVKIVVQGKPIYLGSRDTREAAGALYDEASLKYHGEYGRINE